MNIITIAGRIGRDATTRQAGDTTVTKFSVADDQKIKGEKHTTWWNCELWGNRGTALEPYLTKGSNVTVAGAAFIRTYEKNGETKISADCKVSEISLQGGKPEGDSAPRREAKPAPAGDIADDDIPF